MLRSRISNLPFLDGADDMYTTLSFPPRPPAAVTQPKLTHLTMQRTNFKLHSDDSCGDFDTSQSELKPLPMCAAKIIRPITAVTTSLPEGKYPEPTYRASYIKHKVSRTLRAKQSAKTGVGSSLIMDRRDRYRSSYHEQFQYRWSPRPPLSAEKQQIQCSSVAMGDHEKTMDKQTMYSSSFRQSAGYRYDAAETQNLHILILRDCQQQTSAFSQRCGLLQLILMSVLTEMLAFQIKRSQFSVHVDGAGIRTLSNGKFGRPDLDGRFYSTTAQEQFPSKEAVHPKPPIYPPSHVLCEQEPDRMLVTMQKDFVPLNSRRQKMSPSQLQQVKDSHIRPWHSEHDFRTTHNKAFVPKPYCKASLEKPLPQHISHMPF
uniref:Uncharacterized LOC107753892 n=1 Tax=Sinocyclocheilus rhinocerous TaxID=307959 RepID=A0A673JCE8_9TELE